MRMNTRIVNFVVVVRVILKRSDLLYFAVVSFFLVSGVFAQHNLASLERLMPRDLAHPYLHFSKENLPALRERVKSDARAMAVYQRLLNECNRLLDMPVSRQVPPRSRGISPYYQGGRDAYDSYHVSLGKNAFDLAFIYQLTGDEKYARKSYEFAEALSVLDSWVDNWDKFEWLYWMGKPYGAKWNEEQDNEIVYSYDLGAARDSRHLAAAYDWIYETLNDYQRKRIRNALLENAVLRLRGNYDYQWWAHAWRTNWLPVCFSGVGLAALAMYSEDPKLLDVVEETRVRINRFFEESIGQDGGYQEGVGYWSYAMENAVLFAAVLKNVSRGKINMFDNPRLKTTIQFPLYTFVAPVGSVPFGDAQASLQGSYFSQGNYALYSRLAEELNSPQARWLAELFRPFDPGESSIQRGIEARPEDFDLYSVIWPEAEIEPSLPDSSAPMSMHFRTIDWVIMRDSWEDGNVPILAAKGGIHDDPHHGHLDSGQFAIAYRGEWYVKELGYLQPYGLGYWDHRRRFKDYVHANSLGHNVVHVNGEQQEYGPEYFGKVTDFQSSESQDYALIDVSKAYPGKELKGWRRHIIFKKPHFFVVLDEVDSAQGADIAVRVHPGVPFRLEKDHALFTGERGTMAGLPLLPKTFGFEQDRHPILPEKTDAEFYWVPYYDLKTTAQKERTYIVNVFAPVEDEAQVRRILGSSSATVDDRTLRVSVAYQGTQNSWEFDISGPVAQLR